MGDIGAADLANAVTAFAITQDGAHGYGFNI
jgi:hypothetical protein